MRKKMVTILLAGTVAAALLAGCGNKTEGELTPTPTVEAEATEAPKETSTPAPTEGSAETPEPTETPVPTEAPAVTDDFSETKVTLGQYKGLTLYEVDSAVIAAELLEMMQEYAELVVVDRAAEEGDTVNINYVGKKDGVAFEGGTDDSEEGTDLALGSGQFIDGFEEGLIGAVAGEVRDLNLTFPEEYHSAELAGKSVVFTVTVNFVMETVVPELTDAFVAENFGVDTVAAYISALYDVRNQESYREQIMASLVESSTVENYPADSVEYEKQYFINYYLEYVEIFEIYFGMDEASALQSMGFESMEALEAYAEEYAYTTVKQMLILSEIAKVENLVLSDAEYQERALVYATNNGYTDVASFETDYGKDAIIEAVTLDYVIDYIIGEATIVYDDSEVNIQQAQ